MSPEDIDENSSNGPDREGVWEQVGRDLLQREFVDIRHEIEAVFRDAEKAVSGGPHGEGGNSGELTPEHITAMRHALNRARERVESVGAPPAGVEPWSDPPPRIPMGVMWELTNHPKAEGVDPRDYVDEECEGREASK